VSEQKNSVPVLEVQNLKKYFKLKNGALHAVDDVSFTIESGKTLGIVGESGCGKSTLGKTILRLVEPTSGKILFKGDDVAAYSGSKLRVARRKMQMIFQDPYSSLDPRLNVAQLIADPLYTNKIGGSKQEIEEKVGELMDTVGLSTRLRTAYPHELDGGRRQRIGVARALALEPELIICDEPVSALDVSIQAQILNILMDLKDQKGLTYMFITHNLSVVKHISDEIAVMYLGQIVEKASSDELFANPLHPYTKALLAAIPTPDLTRRGVKRQIIRGEVSNPINPKPGCRFAARCDQACEACRSETPPLVEVSPGHFVACPFANG